ncbi:metalloregulator ArsR/SmtB family transcription factor [Merdimmobilis hominis]|uniref:metalloregulator ArsR/SmtB family transcription factor n=1 Tax=Merdimmobilis hominis TaxID=2897707 RepID=UPI00267C8D7E
MGKDYTENVQLFKAFCDENRWRILEILQEGERCACVLLNELEISQSTLSHHMRILCDSGVVVGRKEGKWIHYSISESGMEKAKRRIDQLLEQSIRPSTAVKGIERDRLTEKTKLYVLTGFLGSGKTTVLLRLLEALKGKRVGVIQNEFGKLGIDGTILRNDDIQMVEINRGSIFCSCLKLSFVQALAEMAQQDFDYLFVESSGLGDPSNVEEILEAAKALAGDRYSFQGAICLVDSVNFLDQLEDLETVYRQLKHCHLAVLTKVDLVDGERICALKAKIREINPKCRIDVSSHGNLNLGFLEENLMQYQWAEGEETTNSEEAKPKTLVLQFEGEVEQEKLERFLAEIEADLYRAKGFFHLKGQGWNQVDLVGQQVDCTPCEEKEISQMVLISKIGPAVIKKIFSAWESQVGLPMQLKN